MSREELETVSLVELVGTDAASLEPVSVSRVGAYARCNTAGYLRYRQKAEPDFTAGHFFVGSRIHEGAEAYYLGNVSSMLDGTMAAIEKFAEEKGLTPYLDKALQAASLEAHILDDFRDGKILNPKGEKYQSPKMTKVYKERAEAEGLNRLKAEIASKFRDKSMKEEDDLSELVSRALAVVERYQDSMSFMPASMFDELQIERGFDVVVKLLDGTYFRFKGFMDLLGKLKTPNARGKKWILADWKTGKGKGEEESLASAHSSLQLTLYWYVATHLFGIPEDELELQLHFLDDCVVAPTTRTIADWDMLLLYVSQYPKIKDTPGIPPRLFFDGPSCKACEYRQTCCALYGYGTLVAEQYDRQRKLDGSINR